MRMPEAGPLGETFFEARCLATVSAFWLKRSFSGWVLVVVTPALHFFFVVIEWNSPACEMRGRGGCVLQVEWSGHLGSSSEPQVLRLRCAQDDNPLVGQA